LGWRPLIACVADRRGCAPSRLDSPLELRDPLSQVVRGAEPREPTESCQGVFESTLLEGYAAQVLEGHVVLRLEVEDPAKCCRGGGVAGLIEAKASEHDVPGRVVGMALESPLQDLVRLVEAAGPSIGIGQMGEDETVGVGCVEQLKPADLVPSG
jgi:hypothetical protein